MHFNYRYILIPLYDISFQDVGDYISPRIPILLIPKKYMFAKHAPQPLFYSFTETCPITQSFPPSPSMSCEYHFFFKVQSTQPVSQNSQVFLLKFTYNLLFVSISSTNSQLVASYIHGILIMQCIHIFMVEAIYTRLCSEYSSGQSIGSRQSKNQLVS